MSTSLLAPVHSDNSAVRYPLPAPNSTNVLSAMLPAAVAERLAALRGSPDVDKPALPAAFEAVLTGCCSDGEAKVLLIWNKHKSTSTRANQLCLRPFQTVSAHKDYVSASL